MTGESATPNAMTPYAEAKAQLEKDRPPTGEDQSHQPRKSEINLRFQVSGAAIGETEKLFDGKPGGTQPALFARSLRPKETGGVLAARQTGAGKLALRFCNMAKTSHTTMAKGQREVRLTRTRQKG